MIGTDTVRRGGTRDVRMNGHLCLAEEWLEQEGGKESAEPGKDELVLDLGKQWTYIPTALAFPRLTSSNITQAIIQVRHYISLGGKNSAWCRNHRFSISFIWL